MKVHLLWLTGEFFHAKCFETLEAAKAKADKLSGKPVVWEDDGFNLLISVEEPGEEMNFHLRTVVVLP